ncbi:uncharacterized protein CMU_003340 [Cryptosporidium muris RN66]|uniref:Uncharacterized protein n=1 Tax=Cryptosporidium muris (strain RN66) TaxID=441375 RepID=B6AJW3_CRYMR|nr:uncharacterized protein CMU_003340 [Cryptosporidium muris RN66]EEA08504.1 hypothetical protein CMU_003340 [Cryptosporidium muris RN66]|eukprot:XP_002142853.1 hypothetical protein [Cryptosporidium muris RN66]
MGNYSSNYISIQDKEVSQYNYFAYGGIYLDRYGGSIGLNFNNKYYGSSIKALIKSKNITELLQDINDLNQQIVQLQENIKILNNIVNLNSKGKISNNIYDNPETEKFNTFQNWINILFSTDKNLCVLDLSDDYKEKIISKGIQNWGFKDHNHLCSSNKIQKCYFNISQYLYNLYLDDIHNLIIKKREIQTKIFYISDLSKKIAKIIYSHLICKGSNILDIGKGIIQQQIYDNDNSSVDINNLLQTVSTEDEVYFLQDDEQKCIVGDILNIYKFILDHNFNINFQNFIWMIQGENQILDNYTLYYIGEVFSIILNGNRDDKFVLCKQIISEDTLYDSNVCNHSEILEMKIDLLNFLLYTPIEIVKLIYNRTYYTFKTKKYRYRLPI